MSSLGDKNRITEAFSSVVRSLIPNGIGLTLVKRNTSDVEIQSYAACVKTRKMRSNNNQRTIIFARYSFYNTFIKANKIPNDLSAALPQHTVIQCCPGKSEETLFGDLFTLFFAPIGETEAQIRQGHFPTLRNNMPE